jgi:hypothetical protein
MAKRAASVRRKLVEFDEETWQALDLVCQLTCLRDPVPPFFSFDPIPPFWGSRLRHLPTNNGFGRPTPNSGKPR